MIRKLFGAFTTFALLLQAMPAQTVQLADGRVLVATIDPAEVDGEGLTVKRLDNDGVLRLRWDQLSSASSHSSLEIASTVPWNRSTSA